MTNAFIDGKLNTSPDREHKSIETGHSHNHNKYNTLKTSGFINWHRSGISKTPNPPKYMLRSYLAIFLRGFRKKPVYSILNITGLALGIACAALIFLWVEDELSFDHSYARRDQLYGVMMNMEYSN